MVSLNGHTSTQSTNSLQGTQFGCSKAKLKISKIENPVPGEARNNPARVNDLLRPEVLAAFDRAAFERDGYWVWDNVLTEAGRRQFTASLQNLQDMNDRIIMETDWAAIDYESLGLPRPAPETITPLALAGYSGGSEQMGCVSGKLRDDMNKYRIPEIAAGEIKTNGILPEYFPPAYDDFILDVTTEHPQMMELFSKVLGDRFILDHCVMLNRPAGSLGRTWHAHIYRQGQHEVESDIGTGRYVTTELLQQQCVRNLCYPEGATVEDGGELAVIPGAHLYRIPFKARSKRPDYHDDMRADWLQGKTHPCTGEPLEILTLSMRPGTIVSFVHHMPHYAGRRLPDTPMRWGMLMAYRTPDPQASPARWSEGVPAHWADHNLAAGLLSSSAQQVLQADVPAG